MAGRADPDPGELRSVAAPYVIFGNLVTIGYFFIAASLFLDKDERTIDALVVTPLPFASYLAAKVTSLTALSAALALALAVLTHGGSFDPRALLAGLVPATALVLLVSFTSATTYTAFTDWLLPSLGWLTALSLPLLHHSGLWEHPLFSLIPTHGPLMLLDGAFDQADPTTGQWAYALLYPLVWIGVLGALAQRSFTRRIVTGEGTPA
ncbi:fluoroquinolone transport system permease protein [Lipingzhangella halophila]|uniref:Fluoroquinolone transport system permease protein n=1 Tax=Lipingzhangella halophila TaxID=1783352 RepID=A0A7W7W4F8_9ACTN|nr:fluoroquinolone transporter permease [Lipingzhangella halophila]MBB4932804.1 fluoroquinolone transport system permease protein [Lipingzhangella halophila]